MQLRLSLIASIAAMLSGCTPVTYADYHRDTLLHTAQGPLDCAAEEMAMVDSTPENWDGYLHDPEARRYTVTGCNREKVFVCFVLPYNGTSNIECRPLSDGNETSPVYIGPYGL